MTNTAKQLVPLVVIVFLIAACWGGRGKVRPELDPQFTAPSPSSERSAESKTQDEKLRQFQDSFRRVRTSDTEHTKELSTQSYYYVRLRSKKLSSLTSNDCVPNSVGAWFRTFFAGRTAGRIALVATVSASGEELTIPLYEFTINEKSRLCRTYIVDRVITPYFLIEPGESFGLDMSIRWGEEADINFAGSLVNVSRRMLSFLDPLSSSSLIMNSNRVREAVHAVDSSLSQHWTRKSVHNLHLSIDTQPRDRNWSDHKDGIEFNAASLIATWQGVEVKPENVPSVRIYPEYQESLFADKGKYINSDQILTHDARAVFMLL